MLIVIRGAGDIATGIGWRLWQCGFDVAMTDLPRPTCIRRTVAFSTSLEEGRYTVEGVTAVACPDLESARAALAERCVAVIPDPEGTCIPQLQPAAVVDAVLAKKNLGTAITDAPLVIGVGPGFCAGQDCHYVVETKRGHRLGRVIEEGPAAPNSGLPGNIMGYTGERIIRSTVSGRFQPLCAIGDLVQAGQTVATIRDSATMELKVPFPADDAASFSLGQSATVTLDGTMETLNATVESVSTADLVGNGGSLVRQVKLRLHNPGALSPDQSATARVGDIACAAGGKLQANSRQTITAQTSGEVTEVLVTAGSRVAAGDALAVLGGSAASSALENAAITLENARLSLQSAQDALNNYVITAPISGTVVEKSFKAGDKIESEALSAANGTLATLYDMSQLTFRMAVNELDINKVAVGQRVEITTEALSGQTFTGTVDKVNINGTTTNGFTTYPITIRLDGDGTELARQGLRPGMNVSATIIGQSVENALCVPVGAVSRGNKLLVAAPGALAEDGTTVLDPTKTEERQVVLGASDDSYVQILSGLSQGETVLVPGQDQVQTDGSVVMTDSGGEG